MKAQGKKALTLKTLTKKNIWEVQENDIFRLWEDGEKDAETRDNARHYADIIKTAFTVEEIDPDSDAMKNKYEQMGFKVGAVRTDDNAKRTWAIRKKPIVRVSDLTYENIHHITAAKLVEVLERNFGGGWDSLSQSTKDIIESGFDISTTTLPKDRLHKPGGMYEKKVADGFDVLEVPKGTWVEAIFAKEKPEVEKPRMAFADEGEPTGDDEDADLPEDTYNKPDEDDMEPAEPDDDDINEDNYRTTFDISADPDEEAEEIGDYVDEQ